MRKLMCPKCQIPNLYLKGDGCDILPVYVTSNGEITPKREGDTLDGYDTDTIYCLGCSWNGSVAALMKKYNKH